MENVGALALVLAFCVALYAIAASVAGRLKRKPFLILSGERAVYSVWFLVTVAAGILVRAIMTSDFRFAYAAGHSNRDMPMLYKFTAWWGGQEGSLLFWSWLLATYAAVVVFTNRRKFRDMMPYVVAVLSTIQAFFLILNAFLLSPFQMLAVDKVVTSVADGMGLNPQLQYYAMAIHPPMLYLGYVGFSVPFAFAMASLITRQPGDAWIHTTRRWSIVAWLFLSCGIMLGSAWAFDALGWGGYWMWDPVENASVLPWLAGTAFLHSVMMQEKKGMMKVWNMVLISTTFFLCIFGTSLTRSGVVSSVHAFAESPIGKYFFTFLAMGIAGTVYLILCRLDYLKSESELESVVSRESSFLFNNLLLLASCFAVLWGTLFPIISDAVTNEKISLDAPWFNRLMIPIGLGLLFLTGVGPLFAWRRTSVESLRRNFLAPGLSGLVLAIFLFAMGVRNYYALISFGFCLFVGMTIVLEFFKGSRAIAQKSGMNFARAVVELTHRNTRRYGGYMVHMGIVLMFVGWSGSAFDKNVTAEVGVGKSFSIGKYNLKVARMDHGDNPNYQWDSAVIEGTKNGSPIGTFEPERRYYKASQQPLGHVALRNRLDEDLYINFAAADGQKATLQAYIFPLVSWIWIGAMVLVFGTLVALVPAKINRQYARTEVLGIAKKHVVVET
ncbi:MAG: heme lyase CcmF/NrfE family subunit [Acidobacteriota bacterium]|nr:heme lyase CcmF/NrfE family subunit [Acidobacteriota bacterium]